MIKNTENPRFTESVTMKFTFNCLQEMKVIFMHGEEKPIGEMFFTLGQVVGGKTSSYTGKLGPVKDEETVEDADAEAEDTPDHGTVVITSETVVQSKQHFDFKLKW